MSARHLAPLLAFVSAVATSCFWAPAIEQYGYIACTSDDDCPAGRSCEAELCAPPPWFEDAYQERRALLVENRATKVLPKGAAVPVVFGAGGLVEYPGIETRFLDWDEGRSDPEDPAAGWADVPVFRDLERDRLTAWIPLSRDVGGEETDVLAWIYTERDDQEDLLVEDPAAVFSFFDRTFVNAVGDLDERWATFGAGDVVFEAGRVNVADNQQLTLVDALTPPFTLTALITVNGNLCDALFIGVVANDGRPGSEPPFAGFFFGDDLALDVRVAPTETSTPAPLSAARSIEQPGAQHRYELTVAEGAVRAAIDGVVFDERDDLVPPFVDDTELFFTVDTDGPCSADLEGLWITRRPFVAPDVRIEDPVAWRGFE